MQSIIDYFKNLFSVPTGTELVDAQLLQFNSIVDNLDIGIDLIDSDIVDNQVEIKKLEEANKVLGWKKVEALTFKCGLENLLSGE